jgi:hypothetical protein
MNVNASSLLVSALALAVGLGQAGTARAGGARPNKLTFTEVTFHPGNMPNWEWLELYNGTGQTLDLSTYVIDTNGGDRFHAANLKGKLAPGKLAVIYNFMALKSTCKTEDGCAAFFQQAWPKASDDTLFVPFEVPGHPDFPTLWRSDKVLSIWASLKDYQADSDPVDLRRKPKKAVASVSSSAATFEAYDKRADRTTEPTLYLANPAAPSDPESWKISVTGANGAYRSTKNESMTDNNGGKDIGNPGQL